MLPRLSNVCPSPDYKEPCAVSPFSALVLYFPPSLRPSSSFLLELLILNTCPLSCRRRHCWYAASFTVTHNVHTSGPSHMGQILQIYGCRVGLGEHFSLLMMSTHWYTDESWDEMQTSIKSMTISNCRRVERMRFPLDGVNHGGLLILDIRNAI